MALCFLRLIALSAVLGCFAMQWAECRRRHCCRKSECECEHERKHKCRRARKKPAQAPHKHRAVQHAPGHLTTNVCAAVQGTTPIWCRPLNLARVQPVRTANRMCWNTRSAHALTPSLGRACVKWQLAIATKQSHQERQRQHLRHRR